MFPWYLIVSGAKLAGAGAAIGFGADLYHKGKTLVQDNGPAALGGIKDLLGIGEGDETEEGEETDETGAELAGEVELTDILDPGDFTGARKQRIEKLVAKVREEERARAKTDLRRCKDDSKRETGRLNTELKNARRESTLTREELSKVREEANQRVTELQKRCEADLRTAETAKKSAVDKVRSTARAAAEIARAELARIRGFLAAQRAADQKAEEKGGGSGAVADFMARLYQSVSEGDLLPDNTTYARLAEQEDFPFDLAGVEAEPNAEEGPNTDDDEEGFRYAL